MYTGHSRRGIDHRDAGEAQHDYHRPGHGGEISIELAQRKQCYER